MHRLCDRCCEYHDTNGGMVLVDDDAYCNECYEQMNKETEMNNRYLKQDKWLDATACGWCNLSDPARCGESWRVEYNNGYECDGNISGEPSAATCEIRMNASYNCSATFDKEGLQVFVAACTEALEMILEHERDPKYPDNKVYTLPYNSTQETTQEEPKS